MSRTSCHDCHGILSNLAVTWPHWRRSVRDPLWEDANRELILPKHVNFRRCFKRCYFVYQRTFLLISARLARLITVLVKKKKEGAYVKLDFKFSKILTSPCHYFTSPWGPCWYGMQHSYTRMPTTLVVVAFLYKKIKDAVFGCRRFFTDFFKFRISLYYLKRINLYG